MSYSLRSQTQPDDTPATPKDPTLDLVSNVPADVWQLIFDHLAGNYESLCNVRLTCNTWRSLSEPALFRVVDVSCHNDGRLPEHESEVQPVVYPDLHAGYRPDDLVDRQQAFLDAISSRSHLANYVKTLVWTLIPKDRKDSSVAVTYRETWPVFASLKNVTSLDLASVHEMDANGDHFLETPEELFPKTTELRLGGTMHRGLVKTILTSLDASKLRSLDINFLQDEGGMADGGPMSNYEALDYAHHARRSDSFEAVSDELFSRQETRNAAIFPGPMWYPLKLLSYHRLSALSQLEVKLPEFEMEIDLRNYYMLFEQTANVILKTKETLNTLTIVFGESRQLYKDTAHQSTCGTARVYFKSTYVPWCATMATSFLDKILLVLNNHSFPLLENVRFEGFRFLKKTLTQRYTTIPLDTTFQLINECRVPNASFTDIRHVDYRRPFLGFERAVPNLEEMRSILETS